MLGDMPFPAIHLATNSGMTPITKKKKNTCHVDMALPTCLTEFAHGCQFFKQLSQHTLATFVMCVTYSFTGKKNAQSHLCHHLVPSLRKH